MSNPFSDAVESVTLPKGVRRILVLGGLAYCCLPAGLSGSEPGAQGASETAVPLVSFAVNYQVPGAGEAFLLWGINGWKSVSENLRPPGTKLYRDLMYTPMHGGSGSFSVRLSVPAGSRINYVFNVTGRDDGMGVDIWDDNSGENYLSVARRDDAVNISLPSLDAASGSGGGIRSHIPLILAGLAVTVLLFRRRAKSRGDISLRTSMIGILTIGLSLLLVLLALRLMVLDYRALSVGQLVADVPRILRAGRSDALLVLFLTATHMGLMWVFRVYPAAHRLIPGVFLGFGLVTIIFSVVNVWALPLIGQPLNYQWIYYSGFLRSFDARNSIAAYLNLGVVFHMATALISLPILASLLRYVLTPLASASKKSFSIVMVVLAGIACFMVIPVSDDSAWDRKRLENPLIVFAASLFDSASDPLLLRMKTPIKSEGFRTIGDRDDDLYASEIMKDSGTRNVVLFVLESVSARYVSVYGGDSRVTPNIGRHKQHSLLFRNIYAHAPSTNKSMFSILASAYPWVSFRSLTQERTVAPIPTLVGEFKSRGYETAFFYSADLRFQKADQFLEGRGFDMVQDYRSRSCSNPKVRELDGNLEYLDSSLDQCTAEAFARWLPKVGGQKFFALIWTNNTHHPYFVSGQPQDLGVEDALFNQYLNALRESDQAFGMVMQSLFEQGLSESTLVVVVGDHGEAFGQHGQLGHASAIYDENVHVPLLLINPVLFSGAENFRLGGLIDLAPTIMDILGIKPADEWMGTSLFKAAPIQRVYFFAPWSQQLFGFREDHTKLIYNASRGTTELYDLLSDPLERNNIAVQFPDTVETGLDRLAAWMQYQTGYIQSISDVNSLD